MKAFKRFTIFTGTLFLIAALFFGFSIGKKYYKVYRTEKSLTNTVFDNEFKSEDLEKAKDLKNGQILSMELFELKEVPPVWDKISKNDLLLDSYSYLSEINFYLIVYKSDSLLVNGIVAEPKKDGEFPVIIFNRGGNQQIGKIAKGRTLNSLLKFSKLVKEGHVLVASCYRENDEFGGSDINDVLYLTETIKEIKKADSNRIGMLGWSRGGMMTYLALQKSDQITTAVVGNGPTDLFPLIKERPEMETVCSNLIPNYQENTRKELEKRSVVYWADELNKNSSLLVLSGSNDKRVNPDQAEKIAEKLTEINYDFELREFNTDHKFSGKTEELNNVLISWFTERL